MRVSSAENELASRCADKLLPVHRPLLMLSVLIFKLVQTLIIDFLKVFHGLNKLGIIEILFLVLDEVFLCVGAYLCAVSSPH